MDFRHRWPGPLKLSLSNPPQKSSMFYHATFHHSEKSYPYASVYMISMHWPQKYVKTGSNIFVWLVPQNMWHEKFMEAWNFRQRNNTENNLRRVIFCCCRVLQFFPVQWAHISVSLSQFNFGVYHSNKE